MDPHLRSFVVQWLRIAVAALVPVVLASFVGMPYLLGSHPGEGMVRVQSVDRHMT